MQLHDKMNFMKRRKGTEDDSMPLADNGKRRREWCTIGAVFNYSLAILFVGIFLCSIIVIATMGVLQADLASSDITSGCYLYTSVSNCSDDDNRSFCIVKPGHKSICDGMMTGFGFIGVMSLTFLISLVTKAILNHE